jgi:hypothetical protein
MGPTNTLYFVYRISKKKIVSDLFHKWDDANDLKKEKNDAANGFLFDVGIAKYINARLTATDPGGFKVPKELEAL